MGAPWTRTLIEDDCQLASPSTLYIGADAVVGVSNLRVRSDASTGSSIILTLQRGDEIRIVGGPHCNQGYRWWKGKSGEIEGWSADSGNDKYWIMIGNDKLAFESGNPFQDDSHPAPNDGHSPGKKSINWPWIVFAGSAEDLFKGYEDQCTYFVASRRQDVALWLIAGESNAYQWDDNARINGSKYGVEVGATPELGDIAVWNPGCAGTSAASKTGPCTKNESDEWVGCGHVAYVTQVSTDGKSFRVEEANWKRINPDIHVEECIRFIHQPSKQSIIDEDEIPVLDIKSLIENFYNSLSKKWLESFIQKILNFISQISN